MPLIDGNTFTNQKSPSAKLQNLSTKLTKTDPYLSFKDDMKRDVLDRAYFEMVIEEFAAATQNQALFNKFLQIDTKLDKALREYKAEIKLLISSALTSVQAQQTATLGSTGGSELPGMNIDTSGLESPGPEII
jgi:hypothetical protein